jgi:multisubunit Na+/H+ antiporter MnhB subunit
MSASAIVRTTAMGLLAIGWGLLVTPNERLQVAPLPVLLAIVCGFLALLLDWAQYLVAYLNSRRTWNDMVLDPELRGWNPDILHSLRGFFFGAKQVTAFLGVVALLSAIAPAILRLAAA